MITWVYLLGFFVVIAVVAGILLSFVWRATRDVESPWLRQLPRALVIAAMITPTVVPVPELHGALPLPAIWVFLSGVLGLGSEDRMLDIRFGGIPLLAATGVIWLVAMFVTFIRSRHIKSKSNENA
jgi:hypothetical protein